MLVRLGAAPCNAGGPRRQTRDGVRGHAAEGGGLSWCSGRGRGSTGAMTRREKVAIGWARAGACRLVSVSAQPGHSTARARGARQLKYGVWIWGEAVADCSVCGRDNAPCQLQSGTGARMHFRLASRGTRRQSPQLQVFFWSSFASPALCSPLCRHCVAIVSTCCPC